MDNKGYEEELEKDLSQIESMLLKGEYDPAIEKLKIIKDLLPNYPSLSLGYMVDYALAQALYRKGMDDGNLSLEGIEGIVKLCSNSLSLKEDFADSHFLSGWAYMARARFKNREESRKKAIYHMARARELKPGIADVCDSHLSDLINFKLLLCHPEQGKIEILKKEFKDYVNVEFIAEDICNQECDAIVSPTNSFGFMDGGLDYRLSKYFGWGLQDRIQETIRKKHAGELLVGAAEIVPTGHNKTSFLICAPTMRVPKVLDEFSVNAYLAARASFLAVEKFNELGRKIKKVAMPYLCTGVGQMPHTTSARQIRMAYDDVILGRNKFPKDFAEAQTKNRILSSDEYYKRKTKKKTLERKET